MLASTALYAAAIALATLTPSLAATDYPGGWLPSPPKQQCVNICANSSPTAYCLKPENCSTRLQRAGDFDYMVLEQLYVPQFCRDLLKGSDTTVSHQNVAPFPNGIACKPEVVKSELTIHGLWANWNNGYPGCCNVSDTIPNKPYNAADFARNQPKLLKKMKKRWVDPTQSDEYDTLCEIYNHEFQKHGVCYNAYGDNWEKAAVNYFEATLKVASKVDFATEKINKWSSGNAKTVFLDDIKALYDKKVMVYCSNVGGASNKLSVIRTCWEKPDKLDNNKHFTQIDCADPKATKDFALCDPAQAIQFDPYVAEAAAF